MASTRFSDDPCRIKKQLEISTFSGNYALGMPGPGVDMPFFEDPQVRMQKWGANLHTNTLALEDDFHGLTRKLNRDYPASNDYKTHAAHTSTNYYSSMDPFVEESRATHPAWQYREATIQRWEWPWLNPQANLERPFQHDTSTRLQKKDEFKWYNN